MIGLLFISYVLLPGFDTIFTERRRWTWLHYTEIVGIENVPTELSACCGILSEEA